jgi:hypothetical protein
VARFVRFQLGFVDLSLAELVVVILCIVSVRRRTGRGRAIAVGPVLAGGVIPIAKFKGVERLLGSHRRRIVVVVSVVVLVAVIQGRLLIIGPGEAVVHGLLFLFVVVRRRRWCHMGSESQRLRAACCSGRDACGFCRDRIRTVDNHAPRLDSCHEQGDRCRRQQFRLLAAMEPPSLGANHVLPPASTVAILGDRQVALWDALLSVGRFGPRLLVNEVLGRHTIRGGLRSAKVQTQPFKADRESYPQRADRESGRGTSCARRLSAGTGVDRLSSSPMRRQAPLGRQMGLRSSTLAKVSRRAEQTRHRPASWAESMG